MYIEIMAEGYYDESKLSESDERSVSTGSVTMATHVKDIEVDCHINSSALMSANQLLLADWNSSMVKLVDTGSGKQVSELKLPGQPWQVTRISDTEAAVTLPYCQKIVLLTTKHETVVPYSKPTLSVVREISVQGQCEGIAFKDNRLIVTFLKMRLDIMDMSGEVLRAVTTDNPAREIFLTPRYLTVDSVTGNMYVSDWRMGNGKVVKLSKDVNMLATYRHDIKTAKPACPCQVAADAQGMIYVAWTDGTVEQFSANCKGCMEQLGANCTGCVEQLGANWNCDPVRTIISDLSPAPRALSYDEATQQLYVGLYDGVVKVYRLSLTF